MKKSSKHYKFINNNTGNAIYYYSISDDLEPKKVKEELEKVQAKVAIQNGIFIETVFWEEIKD
ncbi:hypothetical protein ACPPVU_07590 [Mucilaginibacter sp. McL0603]|uniref:hypothetical protein n=1 Tax=Mucilaginibacter sp. McL0603 TaxID=3415670 RepID=UPI003CF13B0A